MTLRGSAGEPTGRCAAKGITKEQYGQALEANLQDLHARMKANRYRHQPIRRVYIPKEQGKTRPIGISALEDKLVQDAIRSLDQIVHRGEVSWLLEADIVSFFDRPRHDDPRFRVGPGKQG